MSISSNFFSVVLCTVVEWVASATAEVLVVADNSDEDDSITFADEDDEYGFDPKLHIRHSPEECGIIAEERPDGIVNVIPWESTAFGFGNVWEKRQNLKCFSGFSSSWNLLAKSCLVLDVVPYCFTVVYSSRSNYFIFTFLCRFMCVCYTKILRICFWLIMSFCWHNCSFCIIVTLTQCLLTSAEKSLFTAWLTCAMSRHWGGRNHVCTPVYHCDF